MMERSLLGRLRILANTIKAFGTAAIKHSVSWRVLGPKVQNNVRLWRLLCSGLTIKWQRPREQQNSYSYSLHAAETVFWRTKWWLLPLKEIQLISRKLKF